MEEVWVEDGGDRGIKSSELAPVDAFMAGLDLEIGFGSGGKGGQRRDADRRAAILHLGAWSRVLGLRLRQQGAGRCGGAQGGQQLPTSDDGISRLLAHRFSFRMHQVYSRMVGIGGSVTHPH